MLLRVPMQSDNSFSMVRAAGSQQGKPVIQECVWVSPQSEFSNDQVENSARFKTVAEPTQYRTEALAAFGDDAVYIEKFVERRGTSKYKSWRTATATRFTSANANARFNGGIRRSSKNVLLRLWTPSFAREWAKRL